LVLFIYIIPFLFHQPDIFFEGAAAYDIAALNEWRGQSWQQPGDNPYQLFQGFGLAVWFYKWFGSTALAEGIKALKFTLLGVMIALNVSVLFIPRLREFFRHRLTSLMFVQLLLFFMLVLVPYNYLYWNIVFLIPVLLMTKSWKG
jgi:hypothetical protein